MASLWDTPDWLAATLTLPEQQAAVLAPAVLPDGVPALAEPDELEVVACPHPFSLDRVYLALPAGLTLTDILRLAGVPEWADARVFILHGDLLYGPIERAQWDRLRPQPGRRVVIRAVPQGGGSDSNKALRIVLQLAVIVLSYYVQTEVSAAFADEAWGGALGALAGLAVNVLGQLAIAALLAPPPPHRLGALAGVAGAAASASRTYAITGSQNTASPYGVIPKIYGQHRMFPPVGAMRRRRKGPR